MRLIIKPVNYGDVKSLVLIEVLHNSNFSCFDILP